MCAPKNSVYQEQFKFLDFLDHILPGFQGAGIKYFSYVPPPYPVMTEIMSVPWYQVLPVSVPAAGT